MRAADCPCVRVHTPPAYSSEWTICRHRYLSNVDITDSLPDIEAISVSGTRQNYRHNRMTANRCLAVGVFPPPVHLS